MGNKQSFKIVLDADQQKNRLGVPVVRAGTQLRGKVSLNIHETYRNAALSLIFSGSECTYVPNNRHGGTQAIEALCHIFFEKKVVLVDERSNGEIIQPGVHIFPFAIDLPDTLPTSTKSIGNWKIKYTISSRIAAGAQLSEQKHECERTVLVLAARLPERIVPRMAEPVTKSIMAPVDKGTVCLGARVLNSHVSRGECLEVFIACRNHSTVDISGVNVQVVQETLWLVNKNRPAKRKEKIISERKDADLLSKKSRPIITANTTDYSERTDALRQDIRKLLLLHRHNNTVRLAIPKHIPDSYFNTYDGEIVKVSHYAKISLAMMTRGVIMMGPSVCIPIKIGMAAARAAIATLVSDPVAAPQRQHVQEEIPLVAAVPEAATDDSSNASSTDVISADYCGYLVASNNNADGSIILAAAGEEARAVVMAA